MDYIILSFFLWHDCRWLFVARFVMLYLGHDCFPAFVARLLLAMCGAISIGYVSTQPASQPASHPARVFGTPLAKRRVFLFVSEFVPAGGCRYVQWHFESGCSDTWVLETDKIESTSEEGWSPTSWQLSANLYFADLVKVVQQGRLFADQHHIDWCSVRRSSWLQVGLLLRWSLVRYDHYHRNVCRV